MKLLELFIDVSVKGNRAINGLKRVEGQAGKTEHNLNRVGAGAAAVVGKFAAVTAGAFTLTKGLGFVVQSGAEIQEGMVGISKTTGIAGKDLDDLRGKLAKLARDPSVNATTAQLFELAQTAGTMGLVASKDILLFTETLAKLNGASGGKLGGERAGQLLTAILSASGEGIENLDDLASTFVELGNTFRVNEGQIAGVADRVFKSLARFDVSSSEVVGLSAAFAELQITPELAGSSIAKVLGQLEKSLGKNGKGMKAFSKVTGKSRKELELMFKKDTVGAFLAVAGGLKEMQLQGENLPTLMEDMGLSSIQIAQVLPLLGHDMDRVRQIMGRANKAFADNTALTDEATEAGKTWNAKIQAMRNSMKFLGDAIARSGVLDALTRIVEKLTNGVAAVTDWVNQNPQYIKALTAAAEALGPWLAKLAAVALALGGLRVAWGMVTKSMLATATVFVAKMVAKLALLSAELLGLLGLMNSTTGRRNTGKRGGHRRLKNTAPKPSKTPAPGIGMMGRILGPVGLGIAVYQAEKREAEFQAMSEKDKAKVIEAGKERRRDLNNWIAETMLFGFGMVDGNDEVIPKGLQGLVGKNASYQAGREFMGRNPGMFNPQTYADQFARQAANIQHTENVTNTVNVGGVTVHAETDADPHQIANVVDERLRNAITGAMLEANN